MVIATENIVGAIREITIAQGIDPREVTIVAGGGASGLNIVPIARELGCRPRAAAEHRRGAQRLRRDVRRHHLGVLGQPLRRNARISISRRSTRRWPRSRRGREEFLRRAGGHRAGGDQIEFLVAARYRQQVWELDIPVAASRFESEADVKALEQTFHETHRRVFAVDEPGQYLECLVWKSRATAVTAKPSVSARDVQTRDGREETDHAWLAYFRETRGDRDAAMYAGAHAGARNARSTARRSSASRRRPSSSTPARRRRSRRWGTICWKSARRRQTSAAVRGRGRRVEEVTAS